MKKILMMIAVVCCSLSVRAQLSTSVKTESGKIEGYQADGLTIFKGVPFAAPPVGQLRWQAPQPVKPWSNVLKCTEFAKSPIQAGDPSKCSEDCLYLNIWSPAKSATDKLPVLVWIYGGGFAFGSTNDWVSDGTALAQKGVILVSIAYRVGKIGFFAHPELTRESKNHVSGNYGIQDQIAALKWVKRNIARFGGNPDKITIFGESEGGISVSMLCASPLMKGVITGAISESGGSFGPTRPTTYPGENMKTLAQAEQDGEAFARGVGAKSIADLRKMPASAFTSGGMGGGNGWPIVDGYVIPGDQYELYEQGRFNDIPVLIGYNSDEGASFMREKDPKRYRESVVQRYGQFADKLMEAYPVTETAVPKSARDLMRDAAFGWHTWSWARLQAEKGKSKVFLYYFDQHPDEPAGSPRYGMGSPHGQEVQYVFQHVFRPEQQSDIPLMKAMGDYWVNFAKYGDPNGPGVPQWPAFTKDVHNTMYLTGPEPHVGPVPDEKSLEVLNSYFEWRRTDEGRRWAK